eukprot:TRINITY_DN5359_c0_g1_i2.p1 TRINITY_DN5359_c0_g1~~TRINITY_DN5359_c0_g1_i2.p1  ORF type:complete len:231 (+),score=88.03 TRINITY_DN5359_c0_g1_i2:117-809(+)
MCIRDSLYAVFEHAYNVRESSSDGAADEKKEKRHVLSFSNAIAPYMCAAFPQDMRVFKHPGFAPIFAQLCDSCSATGVPMKPDTSGAGIGKKYARYDEIGVPLCVVVDTETIEGAGVTLRDRDSVTQVRVPVDEVAQIAFLMSTGQLTWAEVQQKYVSVANSASEKVGLGNTTTPAGAVGEDAAPLSDAQELEAYLKQHKIEGRIQKAIDAAVANRSSDPMKDIIAALSK